MKSESASRPPRRGAIGSWLTRLSFVIEHRTFNRIVLDAGDHVIACGDVGAMRIPRYCPHQGADLLKAWVKDNHVICHWHGCKYELASGRFIVPNLCEKMR